MRRALIIEDNENNMELITFILEAAGYETIQTFDGMSGIEQADALSPDFIILDIQLPDMDGFEVLKRMRASQETVGIPIIAMTSYAMTGDRERMLQAGCNGYIEKPINPEKVVAQIEAVLSSP